MNRFYSSRVFTFLLTAAIVVSILIAVKNFGFVLFPFVFCILIVILTRKMVSVIEKISGLSRRTSGKLVLTLCYLIVVFIVFLVGYSIYKFISSFAGISPEYIKEKMKLLLDFIENNLLFSFDGSGEILEKLGGYLFDILSSFISKIGNLVLNIPQILLSVSASVIASFFVVNDYERIKNFIYNQFSESILEVKNIVVKSISKMILSYMLVFLLNFIVLFIGFVLLGVENSLVIALFISFADIFPIIGIAVFLIPWSIISILNGRIYFGVGLFALLFIAVIIKNIAEPKLIGKNIGLHPLVALLSMFIGLQIGGFIGSLLMPFIMIIIIHLNNNKVISLYRA